MIRFDSKDFYHKVESNSRYDYLCLNAFLSGCDYFLDSYDVTQPLYYNIDCIVKMTGLTGSAVEAWMHVIREDRRTEFSEFMRKQWEKHKSEI